MDVLQSSRDTNDLKLARASMIQAEKGRIVWISPEPDWTCAACLSLVPECCDRLTGFKGTIFDEGHAMGAARASYLSKPVARAMMSNLWSFPSSVTIPSGTTSLTGFFLISTIETFGLLICS